MATKGYSAPEVGETYARARELAEQAEQINRPEYLRELFYGQWVFHRVRGEHRLALTLAEQMKKSARRATTSRCNWWVVAQAERPGYSAGNLSPAVHSWSGASMILRIATNTDRLQIPDAMMLAHLAWTLAIMGYIDQAQSRLNEALSVARRLRHPQTLADVLLSTNPVERIIGSPEIQRHTEELRALATERGLP